MLRLIDMEDRYPHIYNHIINKGKQRIKNFFVSPRMYIGRIGNFIVLLYQSPYSNNYSLILTMFVGKESD